MNLVDEKLKEIRRLMARDNVAAVIVPGNDPHNSEYVADYWQARKWLTNFSGSAGTAVVTMDKAVLWTDSRYYLQAEKQISGSGFELFRQGQPDVPDCYEWLGSVLKEGQIIGFDGRLFNVKSVRQLKDKLKPGVQLKTDIDYINQLWRDRPAMPVTEAYLFSEKFAGQARSEKLAQVREKMAERRADYHLISTLDDLAWVLNLRGSDVAYNPVNIGFLLIGLEKVFLFIDPQKLNRKVTGALKRDGVELLAYEAVEETLANLPKGARMLADPALTSCRLHDVMKDRMTLVEKSGPCVALKAVKNKVQIDHMEHTAAVDGAAVVKFLYWLEHEGRSGKQTEVSVAAMLHDFRKQDPNFVDDSFEPIMAWGDHSAIVHYSADGESNVRLGDQGVFLTDSGGNYLTGTTDITRTIGFGRPDPELIKDYTLVLKGHIAVANTVFPKGTKGFQIDTLARQYLWQQGKDFGHGTGHGVGFFLCVHEGPARISPFPSEVKLEPGMVLTNEPGLYRAGKYGIRLENMIRVKTAFENEFGGFLKFSNLTWCHFERDLIDTSLLTREEIDYLNTYHRDVYHHLKDFLSADQVRWLAEKTRAIKE